jgi:putative tryptophan/tyrosine transport system permease protein
MGFGVTLTGIGSVVIGSMIFKKFLLDNQFNSIKELSGCISGTIIYFFSLYMLLKIGVEPIYLKFFLGLILIICLKYKTSCKE